MGVLVDGACMDDQAGRVLIETQHPRISTVSPTGQFVEWVLKYEDPDGWSGQQWLFIKYVNGNYETHVGAPRLEIPCDPAESVADGAYLGWAVGLCFIAAFAFRLFKRAAR